MSNAFHSSLNSPHLNISSSPLMVPFLFSWCRYRHIHINTYIILNLCSGCEEFVFLSLSYLLNIRLRSIHFSTYTIISSSIQLNKIPFYMSITFINPSVDRRIGRYHFLVMMQQWTQMSKHLIYVDFKSLGTCPKDITGSDDSCVCSVRTNPQLTSIVDVPVCIPTRKEWGLSFPSTYFHDDSHSDSNEVKS